MCVFFVLLVGLEKGGHQLLNWLKVMKPILSNLAERFHSDYVLFVSALSDSPVFQGNDATSFIHVRLLNIHLWVIL